MVGVEANLVTVLQSIVGRGRQLRRRPVSLDGSHLRLSATDEAALSMALGLLHEDAESLVLTSVQPRRQVFWKPLLTVTLKHATSLTSLSLDRCVLSDDVATIWLAEGLKANRVLEEIDISRSDLGPHGMENISQGMKVNRNVTSFRMVQTMVHAVGFRALVDALLSAASECCLTTLWLRNCVTRCDLDHIVDDTRRLIEQNSSLTTLLMTDNYIGDQGCMKIARSLAKNTRLRFVGLADEPVSIDCAWFILDVLQRSTTLEMVDFNTDDVPRDILDAFNTCRMKNRHSRHLYGRIERNHLETPDRQWPQALSSISSKPDYLYKALSMSSPLMGSRSTPQENQSPDAVGQCNAGD